MNTKAFFKMKIDIPNLDDFFPSEISRSVSEESNVELIIKEDAGYKIYLKIYYKEREFLGEKLMRWHFKNDTELLDKFKVTQITSPNDLIGVDFSGYKVKQFRNQSSFNEGGYHYTLIKISGVKRIFKNDDKDNSEFYLNNRSFKLIELNYKYDEFDLEKPFKWEPINQVKSFIQFNKVKFKPEYIFFRSNDNEETEISIKKEPKFSVLFPNLSESEITSHVRLLCTLYSFYSKQTIEYVFSKVYTQTEMYIDVRDINDDRVESVHGFFWNEFRRNPINLILNVNTPYLLMNLEFVESIVYRFNEAIKSQGETKFMVLYNILEQIRNKYILDGETDQEKAGEKPILRKVAETYRFTLSKGKTDAFIKDNLKNITDIIADEQKALFRREIPYKLTPIKVVSMVNQFQSLFDYIKIDPKNFDLDFKELKKLRDSIFHGRPVEENRIYLDRINNYKCLPKFVGNVMLTFFGIHNLSDIILLDQ